MKRIVVLGATGSIGTQTLDVVRRLPDRLQIAGLSARNNRDLLKDQAAEFQIPTNRLEYGEQPDLNRLATLSDADLVVVAVAGAGAGLEATLAALHAGKDVALATKEVLVAGGEMVMAAAKQAGRRVLPIDSEHSAIFQCLQGSRQSEVSRLWLTASGGPFRDWSIERMAAATPADALKHPTWPNMGRKITIDSATLMNKALEIIEGRWLFDIPASKIGVIVHPQSVVHSMVQFCDGSVIAQLGRPDMRLPIQYALLYPDRVDCGLPPLDLIREAAALTFQEPDEARFPSIRLAHRAAAMGGTAPAVMNSANEAAVGLFLQQKIAFPEITRLVESVLNSRDSNPPADWESLCAAERWARESVRFIASQTDRDPL